MSRVAPDGSPETVRAVFATARVRLALLNACAIGLLLTGAGALTLITLRASLLGNVDRDLQNRVAHIAGPPGQPPGGGPGESGIAPFGPTGSELGNPQQGLPGGPRPGGQGFNGQNPGGPGFGQPDPGPGDPVGNRYPPPSYQGPPPPSEPDPTGQRMPLFLNEKGEGIPPTDSVAALDMGALNQTLRNGDTYSTVTFGGEPLRVYTHRLPGGPWHAAAVQTSAPLRDMLNTEALLQSVLLMLLVPALLLSVAAGVWLAGKALAPVRQLAQAAEAIDVGNMETRLQVATSDEFGSLATSFNAMLARLQSAFTQRDQLISRQQRFVADASHELKTPLAVIKAQAGLAAGEGSTTYEMREAIRDIDTAADRMARLVQSLLTLAKADAVQVVAYSEPVDLVCAAVEAVDTVCASADARLRLDLPDTAVNVTGSADELTRLISNLLENALRHTPRAGTVTVEVSAGAEAGACIIVSDTGDGVSPEHLAHLGERFYRVEGSRSRGSGGAGLGLAICRTIVAAHGGSMEIVSSVGNGTIVTVTLPGAE